MSSPKPFTSVLRLRREVLEGRIEEALNLANIYLYNELRNKIGGEIELSPTPLYDSSEFLKRTYVSEEMRNIILLVMGGLARTDSVPINDKGDRIAVSKRIIVVPTALGGGKTHLLTTLYHVARLYNEFKEGATRFFDDEKLRYGLSSVCRLLSGYDRVKIVVIAGDTHVLAPTPDKPLEIDGYRIHTPWGLLAYLLGEYDRLRSADENYRPPDTDDLRSILMNKTVLILVDEAVEYMVKAVRLDEKYRGYSEAFLSFIRNLAVAVDEVSGSVLVVTLPVEFREGASRGGYQHPEYVNRINEMLQRVSPEYRSPLVFEKDIYAVFRKRLFENIDSDEVLENTNVLVGLIRERLLGDSVLQDSIKTRYGDIYEFLNKVRDTYPFHPAFIELVVSIAMKNPSLGLTRYLLAFVARLLRHIYNVKEKYGRDPPFALITPWVIPIDRLEFRTELLRGMMSQIVVEFQRIYEQDVMKHSSKIEELIGLKHSLSREDELSLLKACLARTIWLFTIPGQGGKSSEALKQYLRRGETPGVVYDPLAMSSITGADAINVLGRLMEESTYLSLTHDERVFYALIPDIVSMLRQRYLNVTDYDALRKLELLINERSFRTGRSIKNIVVISTSREKEIEELVEKSLERDTAPVLFVYLGLEEPPRSIVDHVLKRNNVVLLLPDLGVSPEKLGLHYVEKFRRVIGDEPPLMKDYIRSILKLLKAIEDLKNERSYLREFVGEESFSYINKLLDETRRELEKHLFVSIYAVLRKVVAGVQKREYEVDLRPHEEEVKDLSNLCRLLEESLEKRGVLVKWDWSDVYNQLRDWSDVWDIDYSVKKPLRVGDLWNQLLYSSSVKPHLTSFEDFLKALEDAYMNNLVAFRYGKMIVWLRHPYERGEADKILSERDVSKTTLHNWDIDVKLQLERSNVKLVDVEIVSPKAIIRDYVDALRRLVEVKPHEKIVKKLLFYTPSGVRDFEEFLASMRNELEIVNALSRYPVVLIEETPRRAFEVAVVDVNDKPFMKGEVVELELHQSGVVKVRGRISSGERFDVRVLLEARDIEDRPVGVVVEKTVTAPGDFELEGVLDKPGEYIVVLKAEERGGFKHPAIPIVKMRIRGEVCYDKTVRVGEMKSIIEREFLGEKVDLKTIVVKGVLKRSVVQILQGVLKELGLYGARVDGDIEAKTKDGVVKVEFVNASSETASRVLVAIGLEDMEANMKISKVSLNVLKSSKARASLLDPSQSLSSVVEFSISQCRKV